MVEISEGLSFKFLFFSIVLFIMGLFVLFGLDYSSKPIFVGIFGFIFCSTLAIILLLEKHGTVIDIDKKRIGRYTKHLAPMSVSWTNLEGCFEGTLYFEFIDQQMSSRGTSTNIRLRLHRLSFKINEREYDFHEYSKYKIAKEVINKLSEIHKIKIYNKYTETQKSAIRRRLLRRRQ